MWEKLITFHSIWIIYMRNARAPARMETLTSWWQCNESYLDLRQFQLIVIQRLDIIDIDEPADITLSLTRLEPEPEPEPEPACTWYYLIWTNDFILKYIELSLTYEQRRWKILFCWQNVKKVHIHMSKSLTIWRDREKVSFSQIT